MQSQPICITYTCTSMHTSLELTNIHNSLLTIWPKHLHIWVCTVQAQVLFTRKITLQKNNKNKQTYYNKNMFRRRRYENQSWRSLRQLSMQSLCYTCENVRLHWNLNCDHHGVWFKLDMLGNEVRRWRGTTHCSGDKHHNTYMHGMPLADQSRCVKHTDRTIWNSKVGNERAA